MIASGGKFSTRRECAALPAAVSHLYSRCLPRYIEAMKSFIPTRSLLIGGTAVVALAALSGAAFAAWLDHGAIMFLTYTESGLSWCF